MTALAAGATQLNAAVITHVLNTPVATDATHPLLCFNLMTGEAATTSSAGVETDSSFQIYCKQFQSPDYSTFLNPGDPLAGVNSTWGNFQAIATQVSSESWASMLSASDPIGPTQSFAAVPGIRSDVLGLPSGNWSADNTHGYLGLSFVHDAQTYYSWAEISLSPGGFATLYAVGYNDVAGLGLDAGVTAVPEPGKSAVALTGIVAGSAAAFRGLRRRKTAATA